MNLLLKINQWYLNQYMKRQRKKKLTSQDKKRQEIAENLRKLYHFVHWLNTQGITNRKQRKLFWKAVVDNKPVLENVINQVIERYNNGKKKEQKERR